MSDLKQDERYIRAGTRARFSVANPDDIRLTFSLTMTAPEWRHLMRQMPSDGSAAGQIGLMISKMLGECVGRLGSSYESTGWSEPAKASEAAS